MTYRFSLAWPGWAGQGKDFKYGGARLGAARPGWARQGEARDFLKVNEHKPITYFKKENRKCIKN